MATCWYRSPRTSEASITFPLTYSRDRGRLQLAHGLTYQSSLRQRWHSVVLTSQHLHPSPVFEVCHGAAQNLVDSMGFVSTDPPVKMIMELRLQRLGLPETLSMSRGSSKFVMESSEWVDRSAWLVRPKGGKCRFQKGSILACGWRAHSRSAVQLAQVHAYHGELWKILSRLYV
jgi:hypothetical protein